MPLEVVEVSLLESMASEVSGDDTAAHADHSNNGAAFDLTAFIQRHRLDVDGPENWRGKLGVGKRWVFNKSPMCDHDDGAAYILSHDNGAVSAGCHHNSCKWKWADLRERFEPKAERKKGRKKNKRGLVPKLGAAICQGEHFAVDVGGNLFRFDEGVYKGKAARFVKARVKALMIQWDKAAEWSSRLANEVVEWIAVDAPELWERPPLDTINVTNGLLDVHSRELRSHDPAFLSPIQLPVKYDPAAVCPHTDKFYSDWFPADALDLAYEIPAWLMRPDVSIQKALLLEGEGGNGKSRYLAQIRAFIGKRNTSAVSLHKLESNRFASARLVGKLANICADLPSEHLVGTSVFKAIVDGCDVLDGEEKFKDSFDIEPNCRLLFSANHPPRSADSSQAFFRRWIVVPFTKRFDDSRERIPPPELDAMLATPEELSGLLNRALDALERIGAQGGLSEPKSCQAAADEFRRTTDPVSVWLEKNVVEHPNALVAKRDLYSACIADCDSAGNVPPTSTGFGLAVKRLFPAIEEKQRTVRAKVQWCYVGIGLRQQDQLDSRT